MQGHLNAAAHRRVVADGKMDCSPDFLVFQRVPRNSCAVKGPYAEFGDVPGGAAIFVKQLFYVRPELNRVHINDFSFSHLENDRGIKEAAHAERAVDDDIALRRSFEGRHICLASGQVPESALENESAVIRLCAPSARIEGDVGAGIGGHPYR